MKVWARTSGAGGSGRSANRAPKSPPEKPVDAATCADCPALEEALLRQTQVMRWRYNLAQTELDRLRRALSTAEEARDQQGQRRVALIEAVADSVPSAMLNFRTQGWDEGWEAAQAGLPKSMNPHRDGGDAGVGQVPD